MSPLFRRRAGLVLISLLLLPGLRAAQDFSTLYAFSLFAGTASIGSDDGSGATARFFRPTAIASDAAGNLYVADSLNHTIRKISATGSVTTLAGFARSPGTADGAGVAARFETPQGVAVDAQGNVYVSCFNSHTIRRITPAGSVTTLAGSAGVSGSADGTGANALFSKPSGLAVAPSGDVFVADSGNHTIRKVTPAGIVTTVAGAAGTPGSTDGAASTARFRSPQGLAVDAAGNVFIADNGNYTIRKLSAAGDVTTLAGSAGQAGSANGTGSAARFGTTGGLAVDATGNVFVPEFNGDIRKISPAGVVTRLAGTPDRPGWTDGDVSTATFFGPRAVTLDAAGNLFVAEYDNNIIRKISPAGTVSTVAGLVEENAKGFADASGAQARFRDPHGLAVDASGNVYVTDSGNFLLRKITPSGTVSTLAGATGTAGTTDGAGNAARFNGLDGLTMDPGGSLYAIDQDRIRKITTAGVVTTFATGVNGRGLAVNSSGTAYVISTSLNAVYQVTAGGTPALLAGGDYILPITDGTGSGAHFYFPRGGAISPNGTLYVADSGANLIRKVTPAGAVTTLAGVALYAGSDDGAGADARFNYPTGIAFDAAGNLIVSEPNSVRKITPLGAVSTLAGSPWSTPANPAVLKLAFGVNGGDAIAATANGAIYLISGQAIYQGLPAAAPAITTQPQNLTVSSGSNVQFSAGASASPAPAYQWYFNGEPFSGATGSTLSFSNARSTDAGEYSVVITNLLGSVTSNRATLTVSSGGGGGGSSSGGGSGGGTSGGGGGGGGGAPSLWFFLTLLILVALRPRRSAGFAER